MRLQCGHTPPLHVMTLGFLWQTQALSRAHPSLSFGPHSRCFWPSPHGQLFPSPIFSTQPLSTLANMCLRLEAQWCGKGYLSCLSLSCLLQASCGTLLWGFEAFFLSWLTPQSVKGVPNVKNPFVFHNHSQACRAHPYSFLFPFCPTFFPLYPVTWKSFL